MLKALWEVKKGLSFEVEGKEQKDVFEQLASIEDVFGEKFCGLCHKDNLQFVVRNVEDNNFYEIKCKDCGGKLSLSQNKKGGTLYPNRKLKNGLPAKVDDEGPFEFKTRGWHVYDKSKVAKPTITNPPATANTNKGSPGKK